MKRIVTVRPAAAADQTAAYHWYDEQRPGLGEAFLIEIAKSLAFLEDSADRNPIYYRDFLRCLTSRFPYKIFYRIESESVVVFRVLHAARDHRRGLRDT